MFDDEIERYLYVYNALYTVIKNYRINLLYTHGYCPYKC